MRNTSINKRAAVSAGMRAKAASGFVVGAARIGYVAVRTERGVGTVLDSVTAPFLRKAFLMARSGTPVRLIAAWLRERKVCGKRGEPVSPATVQRMLADLTAAHEGKQSKAERDKQTLRDLSYFSSTAYTRFTQGDVEAKREVVCALGGKLSLTLGELHIQPHPLIDLIRCLEPEEIGSDKQKQGTFALPNPTWWAMRDDIRTALNRCGETLSLFKLTQ